MGFCSQITEGLPQLQNYIIKVFRVGSLIHAMLISSLGYPSTGVRVFREGVQLRGEEEKAKLFAAPFPYMSNARNTLSFWISYRG